MLKIYHFQILMCRFREPAMVILDDFGFGSQRHPLTTQVTLQLLFLSIKFVLLFARPEPSSHLWLNLALIVKQMWLRKKPTASLHGRDFIPSGRVE